MRFTREHTRDLILAASLVALSLAFWAPWLLRGRVPVPADQQSFMLPWVADQLPVKAPAQWCPLWWDGVAQFYPWRLILHRALREGIWPLWDPAQFCGRPFVGNGQSALFYPPNWLYALVHPRLGLALSAALHFALAMLLTAAFCRVLGLRRSASALAAIAFACGGFMVGWVPLPTLMNCAAWLPGCLLGVELIARRRLALGAAALGACAGLTVLAGHFQIAAYVLLATALYALARVIVAGVQRRSASLGWLLAGGFAALLLASAQLLPTLELARLSPRGGGKATAEAFRFHVQGALKPIELITLLLPEALGTPATGDYRGGGLARGAAFGERCGYIGVLPLLLALLGLLLSRRWWRWPFALAALLALWACFGGPPARVVFAVPGVGLAGGFARLLCLYTFFAALCAGLGLDALLHRLSAAPRWLPQVPQIAALCVLVVCAELFSFAWRALPCQEASRLYPDTALTRTLQAERKPGERLLAVTPRQGWGLYDRPAAILPPNAASVYPGLEDLQGYDSLFPTRTRRFLGWLERGTGDQPVEISPLANGNMVLLNNPTSPLLDLTGVAWLVTAPSADAPQTGGVSLTRNTRAFPRAFTLPEPFATQLAQAEATDEASRASLTALAALPATQRPAVPWRQVNTDRLELTPHAPGLLMVTTTAFPGWRAWQAGRPVEVKAGAGTFLTVRVPAAGALHLAYVPASVQCGLFLTLLGAALLAGLIACGAALRRPPAADGMPS